MCLYAIIFRKKFSCLLHLRLCIIYIEIITVFFYCSFFRIIESLSQSFLVELLPYLMQLLFDSLKFLAINFSVACICSLCQLIDVITNRSQLLCYLNRPRFINLGGLHAIPQCPLFRKSWHT